MPGVVPRRARVIRSHDLAKPNYQFEKRQRDLAKKRKQEEKRQRKLAEKGQPDGGSQEAAAEQPDSQEPGASTPVTGDK